MILGGGDCIHRVGDGEEHRVVDTQGCSPWVPHHSAASFSLPLCSLQQPGDFAQAEHTLPVASRSSHGTSNSQNSVMTDVTPVISRAEPTEDSDHSECECESIDDCSEDESEDEDEKDPIDVYKQLNEAAQLVCVIILKKDGIGIPVATGFLVGDRFLMTALHAVKNLLISANHTAGQACDHCIISGKVFEQPEIPCNWSVEASFAFHDSELHRNGARLLRRPRAILEELDAIVLEFDFTDESLEVFDFPKQGGFRSEAFDFSQPPMSTGHVYLVGHNKVSPKRINFSCKVKDLKYANLQLERYYSAYASDNGSSQLELYDRDMSIVQSGDYVLIDCFFMHGASGCPIFRYRAGDDSECGLRLVAMFLCGLPSGHYASRPSCSDDALAAAYDTERRVTYKTFEGGISMAAIRAALHQQHAELAVELGWL